MNDPTRRDLLVTIGQAAVGFRLDNPGGALPPGVYLPSSDHLGHALTKSELYRAVPPDCPTDYVRPGERRAPRFFRESEFRIVERLAQLLLGEASDRDAGMSTEIAGWIDLRVSSAAEVAAAARELHPLHRALAIAYSEEGYKQVLAFGESANICREGLERIAQAARPGEFLSLNEERQAAILEAMSGTPFFALLKAETIRAFYTSSAGLKELDFKGNAFYARSPGCPTRD